MSQRHHKKKSVFDEGNPGTESGITSLILFIIIIKYYLNFITGWIWDRHRSGGGGAPLKDVTGNLIFV
jgi:hypothetical protein